MGQQFFELEIKIKETPIGVRIKHSELERTLCTSEDIAVSLVNYSIIENIIPDIC